MIFIYINKIIYQYKYIFIYNGIVFVHYVMKLQLGILSWKFLLEIYHVALFEYRAGCVAGYQLAAHFLFLLSAAKLRDSAKSMRQL